MIVSERASASKGCCWCHYSMQRKRSELRDATCRLSRSRHQEQNPQASWQLNVSSLHSNLDLPV